VSCVIWPSPLHCHVVVDVDAAPLPLGIRRGLGRERSEGGTVKGRKEALAGARPLLAGPLVQGHQQVGDGRVQLQEGAEGVVTEARQHPPLHHLRAHLDLGFLSGVGRTGWDDSTPRGLGEIGVGAVEGGLRALGPAHGGLEMIGDHALGPPTQRRQGTDMGPDPIGETLAPGRCGKGRVRGSHDGDAARGFADFPREGMDDRHRLAGGVHKARFAHLVALPHDESERPSPLAIRLTKLAVLQAVGCDGLVFLPHQEQGDILAFELLMDDGPARGRAPRYGGGWAAVANSCPSRAGSSRVSGRGQDSPAACARRTYSATGGRLTRQLWAILRSLRPQAHVSRKTSRT
jgi:hypothetical protein